MANEWILAYRQEEPIDFIVADGTGIEKGALLKLTDPLTAIISSTAGEVIAGIAAAEKIANDGRTRLAVYRKGIFHANASGAAAVGAPIMSAGNANNEFKLAVGTGSVSGAAVIGHTLETFSDDETGLVQLDIGGGL